MVYYDAGTSSKLNVLSTMNVSDLLVVSECLNELKPKIRSLGKYRTHNLFLCGYTSLCEGCNTMNEKEKIKPENCPSTHGCAGYAIGSYVRSDGKVVCGICGTVLEPRKEAMGSWMKKHP